MSDISRREFVALTGAAVATVMGRPSWSETASAVFPYGAHVYREPPLPWDQLQADLPLLKRLGFTMVKIQESWSADERQQGDVDLSRLERLVALADQLGLLVYFGVTMEQAPMWLWKKYPDASMVYEDGSAHNDPTNYLLPGDGKPGPCWHHPDARAAAERFIEAVGRTLGRYRSIAVWNVWQEIGLAPWGTRPGHRYLCYCGNTLNAFRRWLQTRYASLGELNEKWRTTFGAWPEVEPTRLFAPLPSTLDWRIFMEDVYLAEVLQWKGDAFRRSDPRRRPILAHTPGSSAGSSADWAYAKKVDIYGTSLYPGWGEPEDFDATSATRLLSSVRPLEQLRDTVMFRVDYIRGASPSGQVWVAELQGGRAGGGPAPGRVPDAGDIRRWVMGSLAAGAQGICFWNHRNEIMWSETSGFGLLNRTGDSSERAVEAARIGVAIQREAELFTRGAVPRAQVAVVVSERLFQFASASIPSVVRAQYMHSVSGYYKALWNLGIPVEFVSSDRPADFSKGYKVVVLPMPLLVGSSVTEGLQRFVREGGMLISEATPGRFDEFGFGEAEEMGPGLSTLFGATHVRLAAWQTDEAGGQPPKAPPVPWPVNGVGKLAAYRGLGSMYLQQLKLESAEAILTHGEAIVGALNAVGKGKAVLLGTVLGSSIIESDDASSQGLIEALIKESGIVSDRVGKLLKRRRVLGSVTALFLMNPTHDVVTESLAVEKGTTVTDLLDGHDVPPTREIAITVGPMDIRCLIIRKAR